jgi:exosortase/archaeosortase family protein
MKNKDVSNLFIRYFILLLVAIPNLWIFYLIFTPITIYPVYLLFNLFFDATLSGNIITIGRFSIELVDACIAGSAYYLLLILNLSTPKIKKRMKIILLSFIPLLIINILRIFLLGTAFVSGYLWFDVTHKLFWYFGSIIFVIGIWFTEVKLFKIKEIPIYSDIKFLYSNLRK